MQNIVFLHHSTGRCIWVGGINEYLYRMSRKGTVQKYFDDYNKKNGTDYTITDQIFPKKEPYGWKNYPFDYYNIWVRNAGLKKYMDEPTLEILTTEYKIIIMKHCFPVGRIMEDTGKPDIDSEVKRLENYKLQYTALKKKMHSFPENKFIVWTPAALVAGQVNSGQAERTNEFYKWIMDEWDEKGDNIFIWDFYKYETEGGIYMVDDYAYNANDSHPEKSFSGKLAPLFSQFIIDVIESRID